MINPFRTDADKIKQEISDRIQDIENNKKSGIEGLIVNLKEIFTSLGQYLKQFLP